MMATTNKQTHPVSDRVDAIIAAGQLDHATINLIAEQMGVTELLAEASSGFAFLNDNDDALLEQFSAKIEIEATRSAGKPGLKVVGGKDVDAELEAADKLKEGDGADLSADAVDEASAGKPEPDRSMMKEFLLSTVCAPGLVHTHSAALVEIASSNPYADHSISVARLFNVFDVDEMIDYAFEQNAMGRSLYLGLALRKHDANRAKRTKKEDALGGYFVWADADTPEQVERLTSLLAKLGLKPFAVATTGTTPTKRIQIVVKANRFMDPAEIETINKMLMAAAGSDLVADAGRVMRFPGTLNVPKPEKVARGYITELATVQIAKGADAESSTYDPADIKKRLSGTSGEAGQQSARSSSSPGRKKSRLGLTDEYPETDDEILERLAEDAKPGNWHNPMRAAVAKFVSRGYSETVIRKLVGRFCDGGENDPDLDRLIKSAFDKGFDKGREDGGRAGSDTSDGSADSAAGWNDGDGDEWINEREAFKRKLRSDILFYDEFANFPPTEWQIDGLLPEKAKTVLFGVSNSFKSFLAVDMACAIATGTDWHGHPVKQGKVLYIATEGAYGVGRKRIPAWMAHHSIPRDKRKNSIAMVSGNLVFKGDMNAMVEVVLEAFGEAPALIVVDVLAGTMDGSESDDEAARDWVEAATQIVTKLNAALLVVSHSPYSDSTRMRGHSHIWGSFDSRLKAEGDKEARTTVLTVDRHKDHDSAGQWGFNLVEAAPDEHAMETSLVPVLDESGAAAKSATNAPKKARLTNNQESFMAALRRAIEDGGEIVNIPHIPTDRKVVKASLLRHTYNAMTPGDPEARKTAVRRSSASLQRLGVVGYWVDYYWIKEA